MGNMPNKWVGRAAALVLALVSAAVGLLVGLQLGERLAFGFTFDWYVHPVHVAYEVGEVLPHVAVSAGLAAAVSVVANAGATAMLTRWMMRRMRYVPPRWSSPLGLDVHVARLLLASVGVGLVALLAAHIALAAPLLQGGEAIDSLRPEGFRLLVASASAFGAFVGTLVTVVTTQEGVVAGRIARRGERNLIARISLFGARHAMTTVALVLAVTLVAGAYATRLTTNVDVADVLPRGDPNTDAAHNLTDKFKSSFTQQVTFQLRILDPANATQTALYERENAEKLPERVTEARQENITDELYVRASAELIDWVVAQPPFGGSSGPQDIFKLVNWTLEGGETQQNRVGDAAFSIPDASRDGSIRYASVENGVFGVGTLYTAVDALCSPSWRQCATLITVAPGSDVTTREIGQRALELRDEWVRRVEAGGTQYTVFGPENPPQFSVDLPIANAHASELTSHDFKLLLPVIAVFIALTLFIAFRNVASVVTTFSMLAIAVVWTFGVMGAMDIPLNTLNLAVVPLIMGIGIDYGIHMMNEYQELRHKGKTPEEAWTQAGGGSALALFVGMLTTVTGLLVMVVSPSLLVAQLGALAAVAIVSCWVLAVLFVPAVVTLLGERAGRRTVAYAPSRVMPALATGVSRARWLVLAVVLLMMGAALASASGIDREAFGDPPRNWLESDPLRQEHERAIGGFYDTEVDGVKANVLIFEGDVTDPAAHRYIDAVTRTLRRHDQVGSYTGADGQTHDSRIIGDTLKDLPFIMNTYLTVRDGVPGAGQFLGADALAQRFGQTGLADPTGRTQNYPQTREDIKATLDGIFASPLDQFGNIFVDSPEYGMTVTIFSVEAATYLDAEEVWREVHAAIAENEELRPEGMQVRFFGNTAINYLFVAKQVPWLGYMSIATNILVVVIVFAFTRDVRATLLVGSLNFLTSTLWIGILPALGIGLAINLTLPLVFIFCMGSDYGLHLGMRCKRSRDTYETMESVGKGVLYSFITTFGAFLVFTQISDLAGRRAMIATSVAIATVFLVTVLVVPILFPVRRKDLRNRGGDGRSVPVVERKPAPAQEPAAAPAARQAPSAGGSDG